MNLSKLEQTLFDKELAVLNAELRKGLEIIDKALAKYCPGGDTDHAKIYTPTETGAVADFNDWVNFHRIGVLSYYAGYYITIQAPDVRKAPESVRKAVLDYAVAEFMAKIETIDEVRSIAESAAYQSI